MSAPRVLIAPDSFKGTFPAMLVARAVASGVRSTGLHADECPVADGGEGTTDALGVSLDIVTQPARAHDPLGRPLDTSFALFGTGRTRALVETAAASGLALLAPGELDPWRASTYGTGELIAAAAAAGAHEILVAVGGSATVDGGRGALEAIAEHGGLQGARLVVLADVQTPWERCAEIYGPQKGADPEMVARLAQRLNAYAETMPRDPRGIPMTGCAGGLSGGLWAGAGAELRPGASYVLDVLGFDQRLRDAAAVVVGEGRIDSQSVLGKIVGEIASRARAAGVPLHAIVGSNQLDPQLAEEIGLRSITEATTLGEIEAAGAGLAASLAPTV
jgi:glycerate kinase